MYARRAASFIVGWSLVTGGCTGKGMLGSFPIDGGGVDGGGVVDPADAGRLPDARVVVTPQPGFTIDQVPNASRPIARLACSSGGDALAFYPDAAGNQVRRFRGGVWGPPLPLLVAPDAIGAVAMAPDGAGTIAWADPGIPATNEVVDQLNLASLSPAGIWSAPVVVGDGGIGWWQEGSPPFPVLALDDDGTAVVTWSRIDQPTAGWPSAIWASHLDAAGVVTTQQIDQPGGTWSSVPSVIARGLGEAVATWEWGDGTGHRLLVARRVGSQWLAPTILDDAVSGGPQLAGGRAGVMLLVYQRGAGLVARRSADGETWTDAEVLAPTGATWFKLADDGAGGAVVLWSDLLATVPTASIRVFAPTSGWSPPFMPVPEGVGDALMAAHPDGRIALLYVQAPPRTSPGLAVLQRYDARAGWQATEVVDQLASGVSGLCFAGDRLLAAWQNRQGVVAAFP